MSVATYVWLALTPRPALTTSRFALRLGTGVGLVYGLILACATFAAGSERSLRAGIETSVWAGLIIGLLIFNIWLLAPLLLTD